MTTSTPIILTYTTRIADDLDGMQQLRDGLLNAAVVAALDQLRGLDDQEPALYAWDRVVDAVVAEVAPAVADLLNAAIEKRLPVTL